jgi:hypothetical protein
MPNFIRTAPACVLLLILPLASFAAEPFAKVLSPLHTNLLMPRGLREIGMGTTGAASFSPFATGYFNPASLAWRQGVTLLGEYQYLSYDGELRDATLAVGLSLGKDDADGGWRVGGAFSYASTLDGPPSAVIPEAPETENPDDDMIAATIALGYVRGKLSAGIGGSARRLKVSDLVVLGLTEPAAEGWLYDVGVQAGLAAHRGESMMRVRTGFSLINAGGDMESGGVIRRAEDYARLGLGVDLAMRTVDVGGRSVHAMTLSIDGEYVATSDNSMLPYDSEWNGGLEWTVVEIISMRLGLMDERESFGFGLGWTFGSWTVRGDHAYVDDSAYSVLIGWEF